MPYPFWRHINKQSRELKKDKKKKKSMQKVSNHHYFLAKHWEYIPVRTGITRSQHYPWLSFLYKIQAQIPEQGRQIPSRTQHKLE